MIGRKGLLPRNPASRPGPRCSDTTQRTAASVCIKTHELFSLLLRGILEFIQELMEGNLLTVWIGDIFVTVPNALVIEL
jgi:hypothetical protein